MYYTGLIDKQIKPGERKTIGLVLRYESNTIQSRTITNVAEIAESSNERLKDKDSNVSNKEETEDDYGKVELLVTLSTGRVVNNMLIVIIAIVVISIVIIYTPKIRKKIGKIK